MVALADEDLAVLNRLRARLDASMKGSRNADGTPRQLGFEALDAYYNGVQRLEQLGLAVPDDLRRFTTIVAWPGTYVDAIEERCDVEGFRLPGQPEADTGLAEVWQANDLDTESQMGHIDSLVFGRSYACVGSGDDPELPLVTVESPMEMVHEWSPRRRMVTAAARFYEDDSSGTSEQRATLYLPDSTLWLTVARGKWQVDERDDHRLGTCPVVPLVARARQHERYGRSVMGRIITITDAVARALTNAQVATEVMALPQRWAAGMTQADFQDEATGKALTTWEAYFGAVWATKKETAKFGQFDAADLGNFDKIVNLYARLASGLTGLPMRYLGQLSDNPPSAEGIRADEARIIKTCERVERGWSGDWERTVRLIRQFQNGGKDDPQLASLETLWRDPATPTRAQAADAAVKLYQAGIISKRQARRDLGYSSVQIANMERDDADALASDPLAVAAESFRRPLPAPDDDAA